MSAVPARAPAAPIQVVASDVDATRALGRRIGEAVSTEVRAFRQDPVAAQDSGVYEKHKMVSLNVWSPVVNLLRDPRWGRIVE